MALAPPCSSDPMPFTSPCLESPQVQWFHLLTAGEAGARLVNFSFTSQCGAVEGPCMTAEVEVSPHATMLTLELQKSSWKKPMPEPRSGMRKEEVGWQLAKSCDPQKYQSIYTPLISKSNDLSISGQKATICFEMFPQTGPQQKHTL